uniref:Uncharacterized protein n=1 Tax=Tanacetum cinerariifolium TaxID=118510 RepID=A0A699IB24_TANCI|nr:hypothetical protein [Tanacetum cinerariifolium]
MASPQASICKPSKKTKFTIIPPKQLFIDLTKEETTTPSPKFQVSSPSAPNAPSKTSSTKDTSSSSIDYPPKLPTLLSSPSTNGIECAKATPTSNLPYGMFLTRLYRYVIETYPHLENRTYDIVERVMRPLAPRQTRQPRSDRDKARRSVSSSSFHHQGTSSHQHDDDDDVETSRASTPSPTTYLNSLNPLDYQNYQMPSSSEQINETLFGR